MFARYSSTPPTWMDLPEDFKRSHQPDASGKVTLSTDNTDYFPFMDYAISEPARKAFYILYRQRAYPKNIDTMAQLLQKRHELANVLGYPDWAAYITADKMVATEQNASDFIEKIIDRGAGRFEARLRGIAGLQERKRRSQSDER